MDENEPDDELLVSTGLVAKASAFGERMERWLDELRTRATAVDIAMRMYERDKNAAGTLLGSALSLRLFLFFVPLVLVAVGTAGILGRHSDYDAVSSGAGISGSLATEIDSAFDQGVITPWLAVAVGLIGMATTGRSLARALVLSSALSWELGGRQKLRTRAIGVVVGIVVGMALISVLLNRLRSAVGIALVSVSFLAVGASYLVLWSLLYLALPRRTPDPGAALPGAVIMAVVLTGLQAVTQLYLPGQIDNASSVYGTVGVAVTTLGWFFIIGRTMAFSFAVNAVLYEQFGSISGVVFGLPGLRAILRRLPALARFLDLDEAGRANPEGP